MLGDSTVQEVFFFTKETNDQPLVDSADVKSCETGRFPVRELAHKKGGLRSVHAVQHQLAQTKTSLRTLSTERYFTKADSRRFHRSVFVVR